MLLIIGTGLPVNKCHRYQRNKIHKRRNGVYFEIIFTIAEQNSRTVGLFANAIAVSRRWVTASADGAVRVRTCPGTGGQKTNANESRCR
jgi:hypothetical protein